MPVNSQTIATTLESAHAAAKLDMYQRAPKNARSAMEKLLEDAHRMYALEFAHLLQLKHARSREGFLARAGVKPS